MDSDSDSDRESTCSIKSYGSIHSARSSTSNVREEEVLHANSGGLIHHANQPSVLAEEVNGCQDTLPENCNEPEDEFAPLISSPEVTFNIDTELGSILPPAWLSSIKSKLARFGRQYLTASELAALSASENNSKFKSAAAPEADGSRENPRIARLLAEKETKNVYYQARLLGAMFVPRLTWDPSDGICIHRSGGSGGFGAVYIRLNFQPLESDIIFRWAKVELEFTSRIASGVASSPPRIILYSPMNHKGPVTQRTLTSGRNLKLTAGGDLAPGAGIGIPGLNVTGQATYAVHSQQEKIEVGQRMIHGTVRGEHGNKVTWTIGGDKVSGEGVLSVYSLAMLLQLEPGVNQSQGSTSEDFGIDLRADLNILAITNARKHKVAVTAKDVPIRFSRAPAPRGATNPITTCTPVSNTKGGSGTTIPGQQERETASDQHEVTVIVDRHGYPVMNAGSMKSGLEGLLGALMAESETVAQDRLDALTIPS